MRILFLTTANLTTNPRLLKEVKLALENRYTPTVVLFDFDNWTTEIEEGLRKSLPRVDFIAITATREAFRSWLLASGLQVLLRKLHRLLPFPLRLCAFASDKRSFLLESNIKHLPNKFDLVISHNLGALYPAYSFAAQHKIPFASDIEDFHPGETIATDARHEVARRETLMKELLPKATYISYASPLIGKAATDLVPGLQKQNHFLINNAFSETEFLKPAQYSGEKIRFVWFSQNIATGRGLEIVVPVLFKYRDDVQLTLIGNLVPSFYESFLKKFDELIVYTKPFPQEALHQELSRFDIGLALELKSADSNRDICLTNKIFAYAQAGLFILATDTKAQELFIRQNPQLGVTFGQSSKAFEERVKCMIDQKEEILSNKMQRFVTGSKLAWEGEAVKLLETWKAFQ
ncbi:hypothetical protein [Pontibacter chitinilyticus]|uniref:hypothetical protein n=1 Tax=Pontibacter chitinilyticus TaxID=2674989 RepID=UPI00321B0448